MLTSPHFNASFPTPNGSAAFAHAVTLQPTASRPAPSAEPRPDSPTPASDTDSDDGTQPRWTSGSFEPPAARSRRFVIANLLPPETVRLHLAAPDLVRIADAFWQARMGGPRSHILRPLRRRNLQALGGIGSWPGAEFMRRLRSINRFTAHLARVQQDLLGRYRLRYGDFERLGWADIVREEIEKARRAGVLAMAHEGARAGLSAEELQRRIDCRIRLAQSCLPWFLKWLVGRYQCA